MGIAVCVLCYGNHPDLARRCLGSLAASSGWPYIDRVVVGLNAVADATRDLVAAALKSWPVPWTVIEPEDGHNAGKYPLMRRMLAGLDPGLTARVMWFDDDSYLRDCADASWWAEVAARAADVTLLGSKYRIAPRGRQLEMVARQPWYAGRPLGHGGRFDFVTGGWWVADLAFLRRWGYPFPALHHNGGDVLLGELCRQQGATVAQFNRCVAINADAAGRESAAPRRGLSRPPLWERLGPDSDDHQRFAALVKMSPPGVTP